MAVAQGLGFKFKVPPATQIHSVSGAAVAKVLVLVGFSDNSNKVVNSTALSLQLELLSNSVASGDSDAANRVIEYLQGILLPTSGQSSRPNKVGGVQYRAEYMLDCVLLSDNLRAVHAEEPDLLTTVVKQRLGCICLLELVEFVGG